MAGIFPQLPVSAEVLEALELLLLLLVVDELDEHAVAAASSITPPAPSVNLTIPRLIKISL
jgi:hypothetical protein